MFRLASIAALCLVLAACAPPKLPQPLTYNTPEKIALEKISERLRWLAPEEKWHYNCLFLKPVAELDQYEQRLAYANADLLFKAHFEEKRLAYRSAGALYRRAADQGVAYAYSKLGDLLIDGKGVSANPVGGATLVQQGAQLDCAMAQYRLGELLTKGIGVKTDLIEAWAWAEMARHQGYPDSEDLQKRITPFLGSAQIALAQEKAKMLRTQLDLFNKGSNSQVMVECITPRNKTAFITRMRACHAMGGTHIGDPVDYRK